MEQGINPKHLEQYLKALEAQEANAAVSQSDGITIRQSEADVPGFYVDQYQLQQDAFNNAQLRAQQAAAYLQEGPVNYSPPRANASTIDIASMAQGNPNYRVVEPTNTTTNGQGHTVIY